MRFVEAFLETLAAERGAARNTLAAYTADLQDFAAFAAARGIAVHAADAGTHHDYFFHVPSQADSPLIELGIS